MITKILDTIIIIMLALFGASGYAGSREVEDGSSDGQLPAKGDKDDYTEEELEILKYLTLYPAMDRYYERKESDLIE